MATVASKVLARIAALRKDQEQTPLGQKSQKQSILNQALTHTYSTDEEQLVDQELAPQPKLYLAPFNEIQANALQISDIYQLYINGLQNNCLRA